MADLRLTGSTLRWARTFAENRFTGPWVWAAVAKDFHIAELLALSSADRQPIDDSARPIQGRPPRSWGDGVDLGIPASPRSSAHGLREAYHRGDTDPVRVIEAIFARIDAGDFGESTNSPFIVIDRPAALRDAAASAARWKLGTPLGPLDGIPVPVKDEVHVAGWPTRGGCTYLEQPAAEDSWVVQRLREAGAIVFAKTHCPEWGMNPLGYSQWYDFPRNVYSKDHGAGGSSTGTAVAVGLGYAPVGLGSDGGGSIRIPASLNGIFGIKPTHIRIGRTGDTWGPGTMAHLGPLGQTTLDLAEFLAVTAGVDPNDPTTLEQPTPTPEAWRLAIGRGIRGCRIGVVRSEWAAAPPALAEIGLRALQALADDGAVLVDVVLPLAQHAPAIGAFTISSESSANVDDDYHRYSSQFGDEMAIIWAMLKNPSAREFLVVQRSRAALRRQVAAVIADVDVLAMPVTNCQSVKYPLSESKTNIMDSGAISAMTRFSFLGNLTGIPAGTFPCGMHDGLPVGVQILGDAYDEASVLAVLAHAERLGLTQIAAPTAWKPLA